MSSVRPGWEGGPIMKEWARYAQAEMGKMGCPFVCNVIILITGNVGEADDEDDEDDRELPHCNKKPVLMLDTTEEGLPILLDPDVDGGMRASVLVQVVRGFLTTHYSEQFEK